MLYYNVIYVFTSLLVYSVLSYERCISSKIIPHFGIIEFEILSVIKACYWNAACLRSNLLYTGGSVG